MNRWPYALLLVGIVSFMLGRMSNSYRDVVMEVPPVWHEAAAPRPVRAEEIVNQRLPAASDHFSAEQAERSGDGATELAVPQSASAAILPEAVPVIEGGAPTVGEAASTQQAVHFFLKHNAAVKKYLNGGRAPPSPATVICVVGTSDVLPLILPVFDTDGVVLFVDPSATQGDRDNFTTSVEQSPSGHAVTVHRYVGPPATSIRQFATDHPGQKFHVMLLADIPASDPDVVVRFLHAQSFHVASGQRNVVIASANWRDKKTPPPKGGTRGVAPVFELIVPLEQDDLGFPPPSQLPSGGFVVGRFEHVMHFPNQQLAEIIEHGLWKKLSLDPYRRLSSALIKSVKELDSERKKNVNIEGNSGELIVERQVYATIAALPQIKTICEIGFNAGHSAALWLKANPTADVYMFDLFTHKYATHNELFLRSEDAKNRLGLVDVDRRLKTFRGFSHIIVPQFVKDFPNVKCELLSIDGGHFKDIPFIDIRNMRKLANKTFHVLLIDDTNCDPHYCHAVDGGIYRHGSKLSVLLRDAELRDGHIFQRGVTVMQYAKSFLDS